MTVLKDIQKRRIHTENDSGQPLWAPQKMFPKNDQERIFFIVF